MPHTCQLHPSGTSLRVGTIYCIGRNYARHIEELGNVANETPVVFLKPASALLDDGGTIVLPHFSASVHHEVEVVVLIGTGGRNIPRERALDHVGGWGIGLDLTARDVQDELKKKGLPWTISKGFDTSACISTFVDRGEADDPASFEFHLDVNGERRQQGSTAMMLFPVPVLIEYLSSMFTLEAGDLIYTGTPEGVAALTPGDRLDLVLANMTRAAFTVAGSETLGTTQSAGAA